MLGTGPEFGCRGRDHARPRLDCACPGLGYARAGLDYARAGALFVELRGGGNGIVCVC